MIDEILLEAEEKMDKAVEHAKDEFAAIRTGRANAAMFSKIFVDYYGAPTSLQQLASFNIVEGRTVLITPFDRSSTAAVERSLRDSDLGVNPSSDGEVIRVVLPTLTEERRRDYVKLAKTKAEGSRVAIRAVRRHAKDALDKLTREKEASEDEVTRAEKELDALTKRHTDQVDQLLSGKEAELLEV